MRLLEYAPSHLLDNLVPVPELLQLQYLYYQSLEVKLCRVLASKHYYINAAPKSIILAFSSVHVFLQKNPCGSALHQHLLGASRYCGASKRRRRRASVVAVVGYARNELLSEAALSLFSLDFLSMAATPIPHIAKTPQ